MMIRALTVAATLAAAGSAQASFLGVDLILDQAGTDAARALGGALADASVYRMYAAFTTATDFRWDNIYDVNFQLSAGTTLYQDPIGSGSVAGLNTAPPNAAFFPVFPSLQWDSFVTVNGGNASLDGNGTVVSGAGLGGNSGWFTTAPTGLGTPTSHAFLDNHLGMSVFGVWLGQFTVVGGGLRDGHVSGDYSVSILDLAPGGVTIQGNSTVMTGGVVNGFGFIPTPGSLALFGLAGFAAARRRR